MAILYANNSASNVDNGGANPAMSGNTTAGNLLVAVIRIPDAVSTNTAVATPGNSFALALRLQALSMGLEIWYAANITGETTPTITMTGIQGRCRVAEYSGVATASPLDKTVSASGNGTSWSSGNTAATAQADELLIGGFGSADYQTGGRTPGSSFTFAPTDDENRCWQEYRVVSAAAAYAAGMTGADGGNWLAGIATFKAAGGGATTLTPGVGAVSLVGRALDLVLAMANDARIVIRKA